MEIHVSFFVYPRYGNNEKLVKIHKFAIKYALNFALATLFTDPYPT